MGTAMRDFMARVVVMNTHAPIAAKHTALIPAAMIRSGWTAPEKAEMAIAPSPMMSPSVKMDAEPVNSTRNIGVLLVQ